MNAVAEDPASAEAEQTGCSRQIPTRASGAIALNRSELVTRPGAGWPGAAEDPAPAGAEALRRADCGGPTAKGAPSPSLAPTPCYFKGSQG